MIYLYAITDGVSDLTGVRGVDDEVLVLLTVAGVHVVAGEIRQAPTLSRDTLSRQDALVRALHDRAAALLPMRFGAAFPSLGDVERALALQEDGLLERLDRVRHREQMTLRVSGLGGGSSMPAGSGAEYLRQRARPTEVAPLLDAAAALVRATHVEHSKSAGVISVYHLIDRGTSEEYRRVITSADDSAGMKVHVSGPSPCYAFT